VEFSEYLSHVQRDGDRLLAVASGDLAPSVPCCPGWTVRDVVEHLAQVFEHKIACTELNYEPDPWPPLWPESQEPLVWLEDAQSRLLNLLRSRGPDAPSATWWPDDQTVGFWGRRMAHETVVHRVDVELAADHPSPVDPALALDGIDEVLQLFLAGDWSEAPLDRCEGERIAVSAGGRHWEVTLLPTSIEVEEGTKSVQAELSGDSASVMLWLWGRTGDAQVERSGDGVALSLLRHRLKLATQ
jgi:uncharacterized protein (TIGR03083 family)